jgi:type I restriction enzyme S subunit
MSKAPTTQLGNYVRIRTGKLDANANDPNGDYPFFTCAIEPLNIASYSYDCECVLIAGNGDLNVKYYDGKFDAYQRTYIVESLNKNTLDVRYLYHFLSTYVHKLREMSIGGVIKYIKLNYLTDALIPLPPLPEQKRIAAILDKADAIRRKRQQAVKLTEELLRSVFLDMFGDPVTNPKGWETCCLGDVIQKIESGWSPVCEEGQAKENEWGVLKLGAVTTCKYLDTESKALPADTSPRPELEVKAGDLLFTRKNTYDLVAASALVYATRPKLMLSDLIFRLKLKDDSAVISEYLWALLSSNGKRKQIQSLAGGSSGSMPNISKLKLMEQMIEVPPMAIQKKYANILHGNYSIRNKLEATAQSSNTLFNSLLQRAFTENV